MGKAKTEREGWKLASITSGLHLRRIVGMCEELGLDVNLEEITPEECGGCNICYIAGNETIYKVYTRRKAGVP